MVRRASWCWAAEPWYPQNEDQAKEVLLIAQAIEEGGKNWIALDDVRVKRESSQEGVRSER